MAGIRTQGRVHSDVSAVTGGAGPADAASSLCAVSIPDLLEHDWMNNLLPTVRVLSRCSCNCVAPGPIDTDMIRNLEADVVTGMINDSPMKRLGLPDEVAQMVVWLCSDASQFNTGAVFDMSGGRARY